MLKTGSPILTMCALALAGLEMPSVRLVAAVLLIAAGTAVTSLGELHFSWLGFFYMLLSQLADSARLVMTQVRSDRRAVRTTQGATMWCKIG